MILHACIKMSNKNFQKLAILATTEVEMHYFIKFRKFIDLALF